MSPDGDEPPGVVCPVGGTGAGFRDSLSGLNHNSAIYCLCEPDDYDLCEPGDSV